MLMNEKNYNLSSFFLRSKTRCPLRFSIPYMGHHGFHRLSIHKDPRHLRIAAMADSSVVYICKSVVNDLRHGNYICNSEGNYLEGKLRAQYASSS